MNTLIQLSNEDIECIYLDFSKAKSNLTDKDYDEIFHHSLNGIMIDIPEGSESIAPYDLILEIKNKDLVASGFAGYGGFGKAVVFIPLSSSKEYWKIYVEPKEFEDIIPLKKIFLNHNINV